MVGCVGSKIKLLAVEDTFLIEQRRLMVTPSVVGYEGPTSFSVVLRKPNGDEFSAIAELAFLRFNPPRPGHELACLLKGVAKDDVPIGTEIWTDISS
ncbi:MAG: hypothetical protein JWO95_2368 [Verrucomicrobiales bacterium]|nr:hypothetical protein [Verrucomicrobiales bacterium]